MKHERVKNKDTASMQIDPSGISIVSLDKGDSQ